VTVQRYKFLYNKTKKTHEFPKFYFVKTTCFGHFLCPSSGVFYRTFYTGIFPAGLMTASKQDQDGTYSILILFGSCHQTCKKYTDVECTVEIS
jgi:hypothetical protein